MHFKHIGSSLTRFWILVKVKILWNHARILLSSGAGEEVYAAVGVNAELLENSILTESSNRSRGLRRPKSIQPGMLEFNPRTVQTSTIAKVCTRMGRCQRFAILEWGLVNPEKISEFLQRMKVDQKFRTYYFGLSLRGIIFLLFFVITFCSLYLGELVAGFP